MSDLANIRVRGVDDHPTVRDGIAAVLGAGPGLRVVARCSNGRERADLARVCRRPVIESAYASRRDALQPVPARR